MEHICFEAQLCSNISNFKDILNIDIVISTCALELVCKMCCFRGKQTLGVLSSFPTDKTLETFSRLL